ncbi:hypothetical protein EVAR_49765_1 [Eumeta japonica]|uniref:Uncharacterized protein n=1 Tax=Eumeta variegata TaxID=151549 RepID=A0A4C1Y1D2_EUMVA|nr:hypothetical protein EVAR_49765_1 [Eumeta japonica]
MRHTLPDDCSNARHSSRLFGCYCDTVVGRCPVQFSSNCLTLRLTSRASPDRGIRWQTIISMRARRSQFMFRTQTVKEYCIILRGDGRLVAVGVGVLLAASRHRFRSPLSGCRHFQAGHTNGSWGSSSIHDCRLSPGRRGGCHRSLLLLHPPRLLKAQSNRARSSRAGAGGVSTAGRRVSLLSNGRRRLCATADQLVISRYAAMATSAPNHKLTMSPL